MGKYLYNPLILNRQSVESRNIGPKFVGYLIPFKGKIETYETKGVHSIAARETYLCNCVKLFKGFFEKNEHYTQEELKAAIGGILDFEKGDKLDLLVSEYISNLVTSPNGKEKIFNLEKCIKIIEGYEKNGNIVINLGVGGLYYKEFLVSALGCHYISGIDKEIVTAAPNYSELFADFIAAGCHIVTTPRMVWSDTEKRFFLESANKPLTDKEVEEKLDADLRELHAASLKNPPNFTYYGDYIDPDESIHIK